MANAIQTILELPEDERRKAFWEILSSFPENDELFEIAAGEDQPGNAEKLLLEQRLDRLENGEEQLFSFEEFKMMVRERYHSSK